VERLIVVPPPDLAAAEAEAFVEANAPERVGAKSA
jgi:hypothetical protein